MGMFGRGKSQEERTEDALQKLESMTTGKGLTGRLAKSMIGNDAAARVQQGLDATRAAQAGAAAAAAGTPATTARVTAVADTGQVMNFDPVVDLSVSLDDGRDLTLRTVVSKVQIPRDGDTVTLYANPADPSAYVYGGLAG